MQDGDVVRTFADVSKLEKRIDFRPNTQLYHGIEKTVYWYNEYYG